MKLLTGQGHFLFEPRLHESPQLIQNRRRALADPLCLTRPIVFLDSLPSNAPHWLANGVVLSTLSAHSMLSGFVPTKYILPRCFSAGYPWGVPVGPGSA